MWDPIVLRQISENHSVIIFDNRGAGNTTAGTKPFSISQFANDTVGLLDALHIKKRMFWSMGSLLAQEIALKHPDRVNHLILYASDYGDKEEIPARPQVIKTLRNTTGTSQEQGRRFIFLLFPSEWLEANPNYLNYFSIPKETAFPETAQKQTEAIVNWNGTCDVLSKITQPPLIVTGTKDVIVPPANSMILVEHISAAWLVQIRDGGHGLMYQYPDEFSRIVLTFLLQQQ